MEIRNNGMDMIHRAVFITGVVYDTGIMYDYYLLMFLVLL